MGLTGEAILAPPAGEDMSSSYTYESTSSAEEGSPMDTVEQPEGGYSVLDVCTTEGCSRLRQ